MKTTLTWLTLAFCLSGLALAEDATKTDATKPDVPKPEGGKPERKPGEGGPPRPGALFEKFDTNGDKQLSKSEVPEKAWQFLSKADADKNDIVTREELGKMAGGPGGGGGGFDPKRLFEMGDKNGDGKLTQDEVGDRWERLSKLDADGDKAVSKEEFGKIGSLGGGGPGGQGRANPGEMLARADKNGDGKVGQDEVPAEVWERMSKLDKNGDGFVSKDELPAGGPSGPGKDGKPGGAGPGGGGAMFGQMDKNGDGKIAKEEVDNADLWTRLLKADNNGDGLISQDELRGAYDKRPDATPGKPATGPEKKETAA